MYEKGADPCWFGTRIQPRIVLCGRVHVVTTIERPPTAPSATPNQYGPGFNNEVCAILYELCVDAQSVSQCSLHLLGTVTAAQVPRRQWNQHLECRNILQRRCANMEFSRHSSPRVPLDQASVVRHQPPVVSLQSSVFSPRSRACSVELRQVRF
jgi:hypothetical protein